MVLTIQSIRLATVDSCELGDWTKKYQKEIKLRPTIEDLRFLDYKTLSLASKFLLQ